MAYINELFRTADTLVLSRVMYQAIVPWWDTVAAGEFPEDAVTLSAADKEFARLQREMIKVVFSRSLESTDDRTVISGDLAAQLVELKRQDGRGILLACGPATLAAAPGLIDAYVVVIHPAVLAAGTGMFEHLTTDLALELTAAKVFDGGAVVLHYRVI